jgi:LuxR family maltose regulon positive regulatory protein
MRAERIRLALAGGDARHGQALLTTLEALAEAAAARPQALSSRQIGAVAALSRGRVALAMGQAAVALQALETAQATVAALGRQGLLVTIDLLQAQACDALGQHSRALACLEAAFATAWRLGLLRTLLDEGARVAMLFAQLPARPEAAQQALLDRLCAGQHGPNAAARAAAAPHAIAPVPALPQPLRPIAGLTRRELEVLELLGQSMSNKRIALALNISELTVKWNLRQIFAKLGVSRRYDAIVAARQLAHAADAA